jgi:NAD(P)H-flavin reductase
MGEQNIYQPYLMRIVESINEAPGVKTFRLAFVNEKDVDNFSFRAGQFGEYSVFGEGECTFCIASSPTKKGYIECTFREAGRVTKALASKDVGDVIGFRGPYGNIFPIEEWYGKSLLFVTGGIALPPLRCVIWNAIDLRDKFKDITIVYGARSVQDLVYKHELEEWKNMGNIKVITTVDPGGETPDWKGEVGFVPTVLEKAGLASKNTIALLCGPPIMIKMSMPVLTNMGFTPETIYTTLENRMKCGFGKCGRCNVGKYFVCKDGPVFTFAQVNELPPEY